jgi:protein-L-isoaspartate(D-aspartate) O-methyltransferase
MFNMLDENFYTAARTNMVKNQILPNKVGQDSLLAALLDVKRHEFVPDDLRDVAYVDSHLRLSNERFLLQPETFARMVQAARITEGSHVLDVACGMGYSTAVLAKMAKHVTAVESEVGLSTLAANMLSGMGNNIALKRGDLLAGDPENGPYDAIIVNGFLNDIKPKKLLDQLTKAGVLIVVETGELGCLAVVRYVNTGHSFSREELFDAQVPIL